MPQSHNSVFVFVFAVMLTGLVTACGSPTETAEESVRVNLANPAVSLRGQQLDVRIQGSGFDSTAVATWERNGVIDPKVVVNSTRYVSPTELVADITVSPDADLDLFNIGVAISKGAGRKRGSGVEKGTGINLFSVAGGVTLDGAFQTGSAGPQWVDSSSIFAPAGSVFILSRPWPGDPFPNGGLQLSHDFAHTMAAGISQCTSDPVDMSADDKAALFAKLRYSPTSYPRDFGAQVDLETLGSGYPGARTGIRSAWKEPDGTLYMVKVLGTAVTKLSARDYRHTEGTVWITHPRTEGSAVAVPPLLTCPNLDTVVVSWPW